MPPIIDPKEVTEAVLWLVSLRNGSSPVTLPVDAGHVARLGGRGEHLGGRAAPPAPPTSSAPSAPAHRCRRRRRAAAEHSTRPAPFGAVGQPGRFVDRRPRITVYSNRFRLRRIPRTPSGRHPDAEVRLTVRLAHPAGEFACGGQCVGMCGRAVHGRVEHRQGGVALELVDESAVVVDGQDDRLEEGVESSSATCWGGRLAASCVDPARSMNITATSRSTRGTTRPGSPAG